MGERVRVQVHDPAGFPGRCATRGTVIPNPTPEEVERCRVSPVGSILPGVDEAASVEGGVSATPRNDLTQIRGVSEELQRGLHQAGILTVADLVAADLADLENVPGIGPSTARKIRDAAVGVMNRPDLTSKSGHPTDEGEE